MIIIQWIVMQKCDDVHCRNDSCGNHSFIHFLYPLQVFPLSYPLHPLWGSCSQSQVTLGARCDTPWTGGQSITVVEISILLIMHLMELHFLNTGGPKLCYPVKIYTEQAGHMIAFFCGEPALLSGIILTSEVTNSSRSQWLISYMFRKNMICYDMMEYNHMIAIKNGVL